MKGKILVEMDFDTMQPVLRIKQDLQSEDLADKTLKHFIEKASNGGTLFITYPSHPGMSDNSVVEIRCEKIEKPAGTQA